MGRGCAKLTKAAWTLVGDPHRKNPIDIGTRLLVEVGQRRYIKVAVKEVLEAMRGVPETDRIEHQEAMGLRITIYYEDTYGNKQPILSGVFDPSAFINKKDVEAENLRREQGK